MRNLNAAQIADPRKASHETQSWHTDLYNIAPQLLARVQPDAAKIGIIVHARSRQGLRRFRVEVQSWGNYVERIAELERALAKKPRVLQIEIVGTGEIPADVALRFRAVMVERSPFFFRVCAEKDQQRTNTSREFAQRPFCTL